MRLCIKVAAGALVAASALAGGAGVATATTSGGILKALCEAGGGYWYPGKYASYCFYKDGSTVICDDWGCDKYPPAKQATTLAASRS